MNADERFINITQKVEGIKSYKISKNLIVNLTKKVASTYSCKKQNKNVLFYYQISFLYCENLLAKMC